MCPRCSCRKAVASSAVQATARSRREPRNLEQYFLLRGKNHNYAPSPPLQSPRQFQFAAQRQLGGQPGQGISKGLATDQQGNIYVSSFDSSIIRIFKQYGRPLASFGQPGRRVGEFEGSDGLWTESANRLDVADSGNGRVQLFQLSSVR